MKFLEATGKTITQAFKEYHEANPFIYEYFKSYAFRMLDACNKISAKLIINRIRWEVRVETQAKDFKINDAFQAHYARLFLRDFPQYKKCMELRELRSEHDKIGAEMLDKGI